MKTTASVPMAGIVDGLMRNAVKRAPMIPVAPQLARRMRGWSGPLTVTEFDAAVRAGLLVVKAS